MDSMDPYDHAKHPHAQGPGRECVRACAACHYASVLIIPLAYLPLGLYR